MEKNIINPKNLLQPTIVNKIKIKSIADDEMAVSEHIEEFSQRLIFC
jgi:hypothetical protein